MHVFTYVCMNMYVYFNEWRSVCMYMYTCRKNVHVFSVVGSGRGALGPWRTRAGPPQVVVFGYHRGRQRIANKVLCTISHSNNYEYWIWNTLSNTRGKKKLTFCVGAQFTAGEFISGLLLDAVRISQLLKEFFFVFLPSSFGFSFLSGKDSGERSSSRPASSKRNTPPIFRLGRSARCSGTGDSNCDDGSPILVDEEDAPWLRSLRAADAYNIEKIIPSKKKTSILEYYFWKVDGMQMASNTSLLEFSSGWARSPSSRISDCSISSRMSSRVTIPNGAQRLGGGSSLSQPHIHVFIW